MTRPFSEPFPPMNNLFRGLLAGYGAKKLGGGCFSTVLVFVLLWVLLGQCGATYAPEAAMLDASDVSPRVEAVSSSVSPEQPTAAVRLALVAAE